MTRLLVGEGGINIIESATASVSVPAVLPAWLRDGRELEQAVMSNRGGPQRPLSDSELQRKFTDNAGRRLPDAELRQVQDTVIALDRQAAIGPLLLPMTHLQEE